MSKGGITVIFNSMIYNISEGLKSVWRNRTTGVASVATVTASLFVLGAILSIVLNINNFAINVQKQFDTVQVFIVDEATAEDITSLKSKMENILYVRNVDFESKEMALEKFRERWGEEAYLLDGLENPLQNSLIIELSELKHADDVVGQIENDPLIDTITYYKDVVDRLLMISNVISLVGLSVIILLFVVSLLVISNTIKIVLYARRREINIMKYVGATNWFIRGPFIVEGIVLGLIGAGLALGFIFVLYNFAYTKLISQGPVLINSSMLPMDVMFGNIFVIFVSMGIGIGILGSLVSLRRHLSV